MFARLSTWIKRLPWWSQAITWPLYGIAWVICHIVGWVLGELGNQAKAKSKKVFSPWLWPAVGLAIIIGLANAGPQGEELLGALLQLGVVIWVLWFTAKKIRGLQKKKTP